MLITDLAIRNRTTVAVLVLIIVLVGGERPGHDDVASENKAPFDLNIGAAVTQVFDGAFEKPALGGKERFHRTGTPAMETVVA